MTGEVRTHAASCNDKGAATKEIAHTRKANFNRSKKRKKN